MGSAASNIEVISLFFVGILGVKYPYLRVFRNTVRRQRHIGDLTDVCTLDSTALIGA